MKFLIKLSLYLLSISPVFLFSAILCAELPVCWPWEKWEFVSIDYLIEHNILSLSVLIVGITVLISTCLPICYSIKHSAAQQSKTVISFESLNSEVITYVASFFVPLVSFNLHQINYWLVLILVFVLLGFCFFKSERFFCNPILLLFGFYVYKTKLKLHTESSEEKFVTRTIIVHGELAENALIKNIELTNNLYYARIWKSKN